MKKGISLQFDDDGSAAISDVDTREHLCQKFECQFKQWSESNVYLCAAKNPLTPVNVWNYWPEGCPKGHWYRHIERICDEPGNGESDQPDPDDTGL